jgi:hypothetical protein
MLRHISDRPIVSPGLCIGRLTIPGHHLGVQTLAGFWAAGPGFLELTGSEACQEVATKTALAPPHQRGYVPAAAYTQSILA